MGYVINFTFLVFTLPPPAGKNLRYSLNRRLGNVGEEAMVYSFGHAFIQEMLVNQGCTSPGRLVAGATKCFVIAPSIFSTIVAGVYQFTCTEQKTPDKSEAHR